MSTLRSDTPQSLTTCPDQDGDEWARRIPPTSPASHSAPEAQTALLRLGEQHHSRCIEEVKKSKKIVGTSMLKRLVKQWDATKEA